MRISMMKHSHRKSIARTYAFVMRSCISVIRLKRRNRMRPLIELRTKTYCYRGIAKYAFVQCECSEIVIEEGVESIDDMAFLYCSNLVKVTLPVSLKTIGMRAFAWCSSLQEVTIPKGVEEIGIGAFSRCGALKTFNVDDENTTYSVVDGLLCSKDKTVLYVVPRGVGNLVVPEGITTIAECACVHQDVTSVVFPKTIQDIANCAFAECHSLKTVTFPEGVEMNSDGIAMAAFFKCDALQSIAIPEGVTMIYPFAFAGCGKLASVTLPKSLESIEERVFTACKALASIEIPERVESIADMAFLGCTSLETLKMSSEVDLGEMVFLGCPAVPEAEDEFSEYETQFYCADCTCELCENGGEGREYTLDSVDAVLGCYDYTQSPMDGDGREEMECGECGSCLCLDAFESMDGDFDDYAFYDVTLEKNPRVNEYLSQIES